MLDIRKPYKCARLREMLWMLIENLKLLPKQAMANPQRRESIIDVEVNTLFKLIGKPAHDQISSLRVLTEHGWLRKEILGSYANAKPQLASPTSVSLLASPMRLVTMLAANFEQARILI